MPVMLMTEPTDYDLLMDADEAFSYLEKKYADLRRKYGGEYVAVYGPKVVAHDPDLGTVMDRLHKLGIPETSTLVEYIPDKDIALVL